MTVVDELVPAVAGGAATLVVGDGTRRNALFRSQWEALGAAVESAAAREDVRVLVLRGAGGSFCAGFRIDAWEDATPERVDADFAAMEAACAAVERVPVPVVAAVEGVAAGAGCQLAAACDLRIADARARVGMPILRLGIRCSPAFAQRIVSLVGPSRAKELLLTGRLLDAPTASAWGLLGEVAPAGGLDAALEELVSRLLTQPRGALLAAKRAVDVGLDARRAEVHDPAWHFADPELPQRVARFVAGAR